MNSSDLDDLDLFQEVTIENNSDEDSDIEDYFYTCHIRRLPPPHRRQPPTEEKPVNFENYIESHYGNSIKILDRNTFSEIKLPVIIVFNHFREKCSHHSKWLDMLHKAGLQYKDQIEFIVADIYDIDIIFPNHNPLNFFCASEKPEKETPHIFALNPKKHLYQHQDVMNTTEENLLELCENLLNGSLYPSQQPRKDDGKLVKICVHENYEEMITKSPRDILLVVAWDDYEICSMLKGLNYEKMAQEIQQYNVDLIFINAAENYVPMELRKFSYPVEYFIPHEDKQCFIHSKGYTTPRSLMAFVRDNLTPQGQRLRQQEVAARKFHHFKLPDNQKMDLESLEDYLFAKYPKTMKIFHNLPTTPMCALIFLMDFKNKGIEYYLSYLQTIHQMAASKAFYSLDFYIGDLCQINQILPQWYCKDLEIHNNGHREFFIAIDRQKWKYKFDANVLKLPSALFYYTQKIYLSTLFYSEAPETGARQMIKMCTAHNIRHLITTSKKDIFLTIYRSDCERSSKVLEYLEEIVGQDIKEMDIRLIKIDANLNSIPIEYSWSEYPIHYYVSVSHRDENTCRYSISLDVSKEEVLSFIAKQK
ncbi:uncharacterized protein LOC105261649 [Musca domestica]|uniref:Uncharacterized protein LOC105261649 n=1 Tax=Musca domestica TaxID=7370 RepID=A0A1I8NIW4_MUSDO|nr:uncharacterized protein LOC105261649 [Musca domestica]